MLELDFNRMVMFIRLLESTVLDLGDEMQKVYMCISSSGHLGLRFIWYIMHLLVSIWYFVLNLVNALESFLITSGILKRYSNLNISKLRYLAVVIDSEEALHTLKILDLLRWIAAIRVKNLCLYDSQGVLKRSKEALALWSKSEEMSNDKTICKPLLQKHMSFEVISFSDGKHAVAKAANYLLEKHYLSEKMEKLNLTELDMTNALKAIGCGGPEPDLMLVYGPVRCHLGFPAWRIRYTEIVHMGSLHSMKFGALIKAFHKFTRVHQNYGK